MAFHRAVWITEDLAAFVAANEKLSWPRILSKWRDQHPDRPAPNNHEQLRRLFRGENLSKRYEGKPKAPKIQTVSRKCLGCGNGFGSEGKHNRLCGSCKEKAW